jgi:hypothetical protein
VTVEVPPEPSETVTVIVALPVRPATAVAVSVRLAPTPPKLRLAFGTRAGLLELVLIVRPAAPLRRLSGPNGVAGHARP